MHWLDRLTIKSRLLVMLILVSLVSVVVIGALGWISGQRALDSAIRDQLAATRESKAQQVEQYFDGIYSHTRTLAKDRMVINAFRELKVGYKDAIERPLPADQQLATTRHYETEFLPALAELSEETPILPLYRPRRNVVNYFQYHFIVENPFPREERKLLDEAEGDITTYSRFHQVYQPIFRDFIAEFGFYDLFLIDIDTGNVVYSVGKEVDFATSMTSGPYRESGLGVLTQQIGSSPERDRVTIVDFRAYEPSLAAPAAFVGAPIFDGSEAVGVLALQLPVDEINTVMTGNQGWAAAGLGETGEVFLVGPDDTMRSTSRLHVEDPERYFDRARENGETDKVLDRIEAYDTTILFQEVDLARDATGTIEDVDASVTRGYHGESVLSAARKLEIAGLDWTIVAEIEESEAFQPVADLQRNVIVWGAGLVLLVAFLAIVLARYFLRPVETLAESIEHFNSGDEDVRVDMSGRTDEFGALAHGFNSMVVDICAQRDTIVEKDLENERLLLSILPASLAGRFQSGEQVADDLPRVSVAFVHLIGFSGLSRESDSAASAALLTDLVRRLDAQAERFGLERVRILGETYVAACGFDGSYPDHAARALDFGLACVHMVNQDALALESLAAKVAIDSGRVVSGIVDTDRVNFALWGDPMNRASELYHHADANEVLATAETKRQSKSSFDFVDRRTVMLDGDEVEVFQALSSRRTSDGDFIVDVTEPVDGEVLDASDGPDVLGEAPESLESR